MKGTTKFTEKIVINVVALKTFKTLNDLNAAFMKNLFAKREVTKPKLFQIRR